ncbi:hypothetical protein DV515_00014923 [Chloebia gouldiae]|uniref:Uncharacterized protein n=1 Tax=Chloebia gouldiae TaxID=44316 RepID=A0A3L8RX29_CHLGU|nr:hypothetical protein DV515_00014923 [Chloebia gouldiae]
MEKARLSWQSLSSTAQGKEEEEEEEDEGGDRGQLRTGGRVVPEGPHPGFGSRAGGGGSGGKEGGKGGWKIKRRPPAPAFCTHRDGAPAPPGPAPRQTRQTTSSERGPAEEAPTAREFRLLRAPGPRDMGTSRHPASATAALPAWTPSHLRMQKDDAATGSAHPGVPPNPPRLCTASPRDTETSQHPANASVALLAWIPLPPWDAEG